MIHSTRLDIFLRITSFYKDNQVRRQDFIMVELLLLFKIGSGLSGEVKNLKFFCSNSVGNYRAYKIGQLIMIFCYATPFFFACHARFYFSTNFFARPCVQCAIKIFFKSLISLRITIKTILIDIPILRKTAVKLNIVYIPEKTEKY